MSKKFNKNDRIKINGSDGVVLRYYSDKMIEVRIFNNGQFVGDICVDENDASLCKPLPRIYAGTIET